VHRVYINNGNIMVGKEEIIIILKFQQQQEYERK
jgi:hypothetical protein